MNDCLSSVLNPLHFVVGHSTGQAMRIQMPKRHLATSACLLRLRWAEGVAASAGSLWALAAVREASAVFPGVNCRASTTMTIMMLLSCAVVSVCAHHPSAPSHPVSVLFRLI